MQTQADKNALSVNARLSDVEALLFAGHKKFVAKALPYIDGCPQHLQPYSDYLPLVATVFVRDTEVDEDNNLRFLSMDAADLSSFIAKLQYDPIGLMVPDIRVSDMIQGLNKDRHINPDNTLRVDTLQLIRGVIQATNASMSEVIGVPILDTVMEFNPQISFLNEPNTPLFKQGLINLSLIVRLPVGALDQLVNTLNADTRLNPDVRFSINTLNQLDYPQAGFTLN